MSRPRIRLPLPRKVEQVRPGRGKARREPLVDPNLDPRFCADCDALLDPDGECPNFNRPVLDWEL